MNNEEQKKEQFFQLIGSLCNETIDTAQHEQLQEILLSDTDARQLYLRYLDVHLELSSQGDHSTGATWEFAAKEKQVCQIQKRSDGFLKKYWGVTSFVLTAVVAVVFAIPLYYQNGVGQNGVGQNGAGYQAQIPLIEEIARELPSGSKVELIDLAEEDSFALVAQTSQVRFTPGNWLKANSKVKTNQQYALLEGKVQLVFTSGAEVILEGPSVFQVLGEETLAIDFGVCSVYAPEGAEGFEVKTPLTKVIDLGTRFSVNVHERGETDVQVIEGEAEVYSASSTDNSSHQKPVQLVHGMAKRFDQTDQLEALKIPFNHAHYTDQLPDRIISYTATEGKYGGCENLTSVMVQRGGRRVQYHVDELIGVEVTHFKSSRNRNCMTTGHDDPAPVLDGKSRLNLLETDHSLVTGLVNPGGAGTPLTSDPIMNFPEVKEHPNTHGIAVRFNVPVINAPGPDVVLFDLHVVIQNPYGDVFHVSPIHFNPDLRSHTIEKFDINLSSAEALPIDKFKLYTADESVSSIQKLESCKFTGKWHVLQAKALATGIDFSDLGYKEGEFVSELFFQSHSGQGDKGTDLDPVFIAGFPEKKSTKKYSTKIEQK